MRDQSPPIHIDSPAGVHRLALRAPDQLLHRHRSDVLQVVRSRARDNRIPDDRIVGIQGLVRRIGPRRGHPDEDLLGVPVEQGGEVCGEGEADGGVFFLLRGVVVRAAARSASNVSRCCGGHREGYRYTWRSLTKTSALGVRTLKKSVDAIRTAITKRTEVKEPKTFWARVRVECILASRSLFRTMGSRLAQ